MEFLLYYGTIERRPFLTPQSSWLPGCFNVVILFALYQITGGHSVLAFHPCIILGRVTSCNFL